MTDLSQIVNAPRLLVEATLSPVQTDRFQPTGFPDLGAATYTLHDNTEMLLVESAQSMANRAEAACWDEGAGKLVSALEGLPYVHVDISENGAVVTSTASVLEAHRLNSPFVLKGKGESGQTFEATFLEACGHKQGQAIDRKRFIRSVFKYDPAALLHGLFMSMVEDGRLRLARAMSSFIEARGVRIAQSGGVKNDRVNPSGKTDEGFGNVPFARTEYTAASITAFMNVDLRQIRSFGLPEAATRLLELLAMYKFQKLLRDNLRLRTACDFEAVQVRVTAPPSFTLPSLEALESELPVAIAACAALFATPRITRLSFAMNDAAGKVSKKTAKAKAEGAA